MFHVTGKRKLRVSYVTKAFFEDKSACNLCRRLRTFSTGHMQKSFTVEELVFQKRCIDGAVLTANTKLLRVKRFVFNSASATGYSEQHSAAKRPDPTLRLVTASEDQPGDRSNRTSDKQSIRSKYSYGVLTVAYRLRQRLLAKLALASLGLCAAALGWTIGAL